MSVSDYERKVEEVRAWIARGDVYQINLSRRAQASYTGAALTFFSDSLRKSSPVCRFFGCGRFSTDIEFSRTIFTKVGPAISDASD